MTSSDHSSTSASECESGELSSDEYPSQIKVKPFSIIPCQENQFDSTHEMGTLAQLLNHSFPVQINGSMASHKYVSTSASVRLTGEFFLLDWTRMFIVMKFLIIGCVQHHRRLGSKLTWKRVDYQIICRRRSNGRRRVTNNGITPMISWRPWLNDVWMLLLSWSH